MGISQKRRRSIKFHIEHDDYFGTLATVLDLYRQMLGNPTQKRNIADGLANMVDDLLYLQHTSRIKPKKE